MKLNKLAYFIFKTTWKSYFKNNEKNTWKFTKKPGKIMEISWNFVSPKKWEPCIPFLSIIGVQLIVSEMKGKDSLECGRMYT